MITLKINNKTMEVEEGTSIIDAADAHGIYIPRFCYHKKLSVVANCRMCLVEVEGVKKPLPACATLVSEGMEVWTQSQKALDAQRAVMEFLLINHPLDCPICDQGGQCELQDLAMGFGHADSDFTMRKHTVQSLNLGPLIATDMTRCIRCTRCIRVGTEICGEDQMGATERGVDTEIGTYIAQTITSPLSGNMIDVCPVGALTSKPDAAQSRPWELYEHKTLATHDCWGTHTFTHTKGFEYTRRKKVMRVVPRQCEQINETWIADRERFSFLSYEHSGRAVEPMIKRNGQWVKAGFEAILLETIDKLSAVQQQKSAERIAAVCSPNVSIEEGYILQKFMRALGSENVDHRIRMLDLDYPQNFAAIKATEKAAEIIENSEHILIVGSHLPHEVPLANLRVLKATQNDATVSVINDRDYPFNYSLNHKVISPANQMLTQIELLASALNGEQTPNAQINTIAKHILAGEPSTVILGHAWQRNAQALSIYEKLQQQADKHHFNLIILTEGANSFGLNAANVLPNKDGLNYLQSMQHENIDACLLYQLEPELDCFADYDLRASLRAMPLVVCITSFVSKDMLDYADVILPATMPFEMAGTYLNAQNMMQHVKAVTDPLEEARPGYKIVQALAKLMELDGFDHEHCEAILDEVKQHSLHNEWHHMKVADINSADTLSIHFEWPMLRVDASCRRSDALQKLEQSRWQVDYPVIRINEEMAAHYRLDNNDIAAIKNTNQKYICRIDNTVPNSAITIELGIVPTTMPKMSETITLSKES